MEKILIYLSCLILIFNFVYSADYLKTQPNYLPPCQINSSDFVKCSTVTIQSLFKQLNLGIPGLKTLDTIDPFHVTKINFNQNNNNVANLNANLTKVVVTGFANTIVKQSKVSKKDYSWETKFIVPVLKIQGNYAMDGRVLLLPLQGNGKMFLQPENVDIVMHTKTRLYEKGGLTFYNVTKVKIDMNISNLKSNFDNLFDGNLELGKSINTLFNENWRDFFEAMRPIVSDTIEEILLSILQRVFDYIPANFLISDIPTSEQLYG